MEAQEFQRLSQELQDGIKAIREKQTTLENLKLDKDIIDKELKPTIVAVQTKLDQMEVDLKQMKIHRVSDKEPSAEHKAFMDYLRYGQKSDLLKAYRPPGMESKVMKISDDTTGGYLASPEIATEIIKNITEYSPIRSIASIRTTSKESIKQRRRTGTFSANWVGEIDDRPETTGLLYGLETLPIHELYARVDISNWDLEDPDYNMEAEINSEFGEQFGVAEGTAFVSGNTTTRPEGILTNANVGAANSGNANEVTADGLITIYFTPKSGYAKNYKWIMNRATMAACSKLKNNQNDYLLRRLGESPVWSILGADVVECVDMPTMAANAYPIALGDFRQGYLIVDRIAISVLRDPYSAANTNCVRFHARKRVGGMVIKPEAIYKHYMHT